MLAAKSVLLCLPFAAAVEFAQLILDCVTVDQNIQTLTYAVGNWSESQGILGAIPILQDEQTLDQSINTATSDCLQSPQLTSDQTANMAALIENYIIPDTATLLAAMEAKKQDFIDVGVLPTVQNSINSLRTDQASCSSALLAITPAANQQQGINDANTIDGYFAEAVAYFSS
ncbi:uncharacterized protein LY89DRAFT_413246 [Mollisia scopiformis]|uniref:Uncharacterized protein n=1 Tax=Mollisia scopiformis TaxID=149040 RepID=A0A132B1U1_MOLSC|nr:uncharacterized protein LY89DRAFT_413246 [Mollisia scopiformis]KUJ06342.1 hypothetical protein LY89DRAFT_413246 [Mollisia scopiformis]